MIDIAKALNRPASYPTKFFGTERGAQVCSSFPPWVVYVFMYIMWYIFLGGVYVFIHIIRFYMSIMSRLCRAVRRENRVGNLFKPRT